MANTSVHAGFNQSGGAYFIIVDPSGVSGKLNVFTPGTGSGGAATVGTMTVTSAATIAPGLSSASSWVGVGKLIKDMGKSVVAKDVNGNLLTYRKFQVVQAPSAVLPAPGAGGQMGKSPDYFSFYLEVGREGAATSAGPAGIARYF